MSADLAGRVALITGAGSGIGRATAVRMARQGAVLALFDIDADGLKQTAALVEGEHDVLTSVVDVSDDTQVTRGVTHLAERLGRLDIVVNNAGTMLPASLSETSVEQWDTVFAVNTRSHFLVTKAAWPLLCESRGAIVHTASIAGVFSFAGMPAYNASKAAVLGITRSFATDGAAHGIRANAVVPGYIDTNMPAKILEAVPEEHRAAAIEGFSARQLIKRPGTADEVAAAIVFLASPDASFITGSVVAVDGGWGAW